MLPLTSTLRVCHGGPQCTETMLWSTEHVRHSQTSSSSRRSSDFRPALILSASGDSKCSGPLCASIFLPTRASLVKQVNGVPRFATIFPLSKCSVRLAIAITYTAEHNSKRDRHRTIESGLRSVRMLGRQQTSNAPTFRKSVKVSLSVP